MENFYVKNQYTSEEYIEALRKGSGARAVLYYSVYSVLKEMGLDCKKILTASVVKYNDVFANGKNFYDADHTPKDFAGMFTCGDIAEAKAFGQEFISADDERSILRMHDCPLAAMWKKINVSAEEMKDLCDIANVMDYDTARRFGGINLEITSQMGYGDEYCELVATKK